MLVVAVLLIGCVVAVQQESTPATFSLWHGNFKEYAKENNGINTACYAIQHELFEMLELDPVHFKNEIFAKTFPLFLVECGRGRAMELGMVVTKGMRNFHRGIVTPYKDHDVAFPISSSTTSDEPAMDIDDTLFEKHYGPPSPDSIFDTIDSLHMASNRLNGSVSPLDDPFLKEMDKQEYINKLQYDAVFPCHHLRLAPPRYTLFSGFDYQEKAITTKQTCTRLKEGLDESSNTEILAEAFPLLLLYCGKADAHTVALEYILEQCAIRIETTIGCDKERIISFLFLVTKVYEQREPDDDDANLCTYDNGMVHLTLHCDAIPFINDLLNGHWLHGLLVSKDVMDTHVQISTTMGWIQQVDTIPLFRIPYWSKFRSILFEYMQEVYGFDEKDACKSTAPCVKSVLDKSSWDCVDKEISANRVLNHQLHMKWANACEVWLVDVDQDLVMCLEYVKSELERKICCG
jgi:hypothetical protein